MSKPVEILFVHGAAHGAWCWDEKFLPFFSKNHYTSHALSFRGHGKNSRNQLRWVRISHYISDLAKVVERINRPLVLVGHSLGGLIVQKYLESHEARAAVLCASVPIRGIGRALVRVAGRHPGIVLSSILKFRMRPLVSTPRLIRELFFSDSTPIETIRRYAPLIEDESLLALIEAIWLLPRPNRIHVPIMVLGAENDAFFGIKEVQATALTYNTTAEFVPNLGHDMMLDTNWQEAATKILLWVEKRVASRGASLGQ